MIERVFPPEKIEKGKESVSIGSSSSSSSLDHDKVETSSKLRNEVNLASRDQEGDDHDDRKQQWEHIQAEWDAPWESTLVDPDSRGASFIDKGKGKAKITPFSTTHSTTHKLSSFAERSESQRSLRLSKVEERPLRWTLQRSPFHTSQIGKLASQKEQHSIGIFKPNYPFTPSGRRRKRLKTDPKAPIVYDYTVNPAIVNSNVMMHGWTAYILDDDVKLSVPDESRRSRQTSLYSRELLGKKWYRWMPGQGWVYGRKKDLSVYQHGPGIALGQLLPPREKAVTGQLPLIPNDSKRDFVYMLVSSLLFFFVIALLKEYRRHRKSNKKGKRRIASSVINNNHILRSNGGGGGGDSRSILWSSRSRQRSKAQSFRELCTFALGKSNGGMNHQAATGNTAGVLANIRWPSSSSDGVSSGLSNGRALRRGQSFYDDEREGAKIEMLEKGGVTESSIDSVISQAKDD